jgi:hypothetical protein
MSDTKAKAGEIVEASFRSLTAKAGAGRSWREREALFAGVWNISPMSYRAAQAVVDAVTSVTAQLKPGQSVKSSGFNFTRGDSAREGYVLIRMEEEQGQGKWSLESSSHMGRQWFALRQRHNDIPYILCSGELAQVKQGVPVRVQSVNHNPAKFRDLTRLATALRAGKARGEVKVFPSDPTSPVLALDGGVPGEHARRLHRLLYEDAAARAVGWAMPLFGKLTQIYAREGFNWGEAAATWSMPADGRFPDFRSPTTISCLIPRPDRNSVAMVFRDAQPNLETETYIVWMDIVKGTLNLLPVGEGSVEDIEEFMASGGVPALTCAPETGGVRVTERAMSSSVLQSFCDHVGEAWLVLNDLPLYAAEGERPMVTHDFTPFGEIAPWTL